MAQESITTPERLCGLDKQPPSNGNISHTLATKDSPKLAIETRSISVGTAESLDTTTTKTEKWSYRQLADRLPLGAISGLLSLLVAVSCVFFSLAILITSNGQSAQSWSIQPSVYIAISSAIANVAVGYAYSKAVPIAWWYRASRGATVRSLQRQWEAGSSLPLAIINARGRDARYPTAVAILAALMIIDGPLLQRAASVRNASTSSMVTLDFALSPEVPTGFSGFGEGQENIFVRRAVRIGEDWQEGRPIILPTSPACKGKCRGKVVGPGLSSTGCNTTSWPISSAMYHDPNATWGPSVDDPKSSFMIGQNSRNPAFVTSLKPHTMPGLPLSEAAWLHQGILKLIDGTGSYEATTCWWLPALLEYDVEFDDRNEVTLLKNSSSTGRLVSLANNTQAFDADMSLPFTTDYFTFHLAAFVVANASAWPPEVNTHNETVYGWTVDDASLGAQAVKYMRAAGKTGSTAADSNYYDNAAADIDSATTNINFADPTIDIINNLNEMLFRAAVMSANWANLTSLVDPGITPNQTTLAAQTITENVFHSDFRWYAAATALEVLIVLAVLPMFWGWWTLNKTLDLSPFDIALAFDAPLVRGSELSRGAPGVVEKYGSQRIRYRQMPGHVEVFDGVEAANRSNGSVGFERIDIGGDEDKISV